MKTTIVFLVLFFGIMATVSAQDTVITRMYATNGNGNVLAPQDQPVQEKRKRSKPLLNRENYEIGLQLAGGISFFPVFDSGITGINYGDESRFGLMGGGGFFLDIYPTGKTYPWLLGTGLSYWGHNYKTDSFSYINWDVYGGARRESFLYMKLGFTFSFLQDVTLVTHNGILFNSKSGFNPTVFGMMAEMGYPTKHFDFGVKFLFMGTNIWKSDVFSDGDISSSITTITFTFAYKLSF
jgi:hypothetical protein